MWRHHKNFFISIVSYIIAQPSHLWVRYLIIGEKWKKFLFYSIWLQSFCGLQCDKVCPLLFCLVWQKFGSIIVISLCDTTGPFKCDSLWHKQSTDSIIICNICSHWLSKDTVITTVITEHDCDMTTDNVTYMVLQTGWWSWNWLYYHCFAC